MTKTTTRVASGYARHDGPHDTAYAQHREELEEETPPVAKPEPENNDTSNAKLFIGRHGADLRYVKALKKWLYWTETHWAIDEIDHVKELGKETVRWMYQTAYDAPKDQQANLIRWALRSGDAKYIRNMLELAQCDPAVARTPESFDQNHYLLNVQNGTIDLRSGELKDHSPNDDLTYCIPVYYDPKAQCPVWRSFLRTIMLDRGGLVEYLQRAIGYCFAGDVKEECMFLLHGGGANGKSNVNPILLANWPQGRKSAYFCYSPGPIFRAVHLPMSSPTVSNPG